MPRTRIGRRRAFSLLEVMVAVTIFGLSVTIILSGIAGVTAGDRASASLGTAISLARCRMTEIEEKQLKLGFPEIEESDSSLTCCGENAVGNFRCEWKVERVTLPTMPLGGGMGDGGLNSLLGNLTGGADAGAALSQGMGGLAPGMLNPAGSSASLNFDGGGIAALGGAFTQQVSGAGGMNGILSLVFGMVYPTFKPLLEAGIRRVTVTVRWEDGKKPRSLEVMQFLTNPARSGFLSAFAHDGGVSADGGPAATTPATTTPGATTPGTTPGIGAGR